MIQSNVSPILTPTETKMAAPIQSFADVHDMLDDLVTNVKFMGSQARTAQPGSAGSAANDAAATERAIFNKLLDIGRALFTGYTQEVGPGDEGFRVTHNGEAYTRKHQHTRTLLTVFGKVTISRCIYTSPSQGVPRYVPTEARLNLPGRKHSYFVQQMLSRLTLKDTHREAVGFFEELFGHKISTMTTDNLMPEIAVETLAFNETLQPKLPGEVGPDGRVAEPAEGLLQVISFDGKGVPIIKDEPAEMTPRLTKGKKRQTTKEALVGLEYLVAPKIRDAHSVAMNLVMPKAVKVRAQAPEEPAPEAFYQRASFVHYESNLTDKYSVFDRIGERVDARGERASSPLPQVCVIDGAERLISRAKARFPAATIVLDIIHVSEYLWQAAHAVHGEGSPRARTMVLAHLERILEGKVGRVIGGLRQRCAAHRKLTSKRREKIEKAITYFENHREYMCYDTYLEQGFPIGTGVVESACGHLVKERMDKAGARWSPPGADAMLRLRAIYASGNWNDFLAFHERKKHQLLYGKAA